MKESFENEVENSKNKLYEYFKTHVIMMKMA